MYAKTILNGMLAALLASSAVATTTSPEYKALRRREDAPKHCVDDNVDGPKTKGNLYCVDSDGVTLSCDQCLGLDGNDPAKADDGVICYLTTGGEDLGDITACPGDPAPKKNPDGSDNTTGEDLVDAYCTAAGALAVGGILTFAECYGFALAEAGGNEYEQIKAGIDSVCDAILVGLCSCIKSGVCG